MGAATGLSSGHFGGRGAIYLVGDLQVSIGFCMGAVFCINMQCVAEPLPGVSRGPGGIVPARAASSWNLGRVGQIIRCVWNQTSLGWKKMVVSPSVMLFPSPRALPRAAQDCPQQVRVNIPVLLVVG